MKHTFKHLVLFFILSICGIAFMTAQTTVPQAVRVQIDSAITEKKAAAVAQILHANKSYTYFSQLEEYVLNASRQLVLSNNLDFARELTLAVVDNNLDNFEALDLYSSINNAIVRRDALKKAEEEAQQLALIQKQTIDKKTKDSISKEYKTSTNTITGETVYLDQNSGLFYNNTSWNAAFSLINITLNIQPKTIIAQYGIGINGFYLKRDKSFNYAIDGSINCLLLTLNSDASFSFDIKLVPSVSINAFSKSFMLRTGIYSDIVYGSHSSAFLTPIVGFGFKNIRVGDIAFIDAYADYYPGHWYSGMVFAGDIGVASSFFISEFKNINLYINLAIRDTIYIYTKEIKHHASLVFSIGVGKNE